MSADAETKRSTFTGHKLDWMKCVSFDRRLESYDFKVGFVIAQHVNQHTGTAMLSDETIADEAGNGSVRNTVRARQRLRDAGWIAWRRTRTANVYELRFDNVERYLDMITVSRDARRDRRQKELSATGSSPRSCDAGVVTRSRSYDARVRRDQTLESDKHL